MEMAKRPHTVVALGASAGGLESLGRILAGLPEDFPATILIVLHLDPHHRSQVVPLLQNRTKLRVQTARPSIHAKPGTVYVAPPDNHLEINAGKLRLTKAPRVNYSRPSIDLLFTSVAADCGPNGIVAVLSGTGSDGAAGLVAVKARGGLAVAEEASTATYPAMPAAAIRTGLLDAVLPVGQIPAFLMRAVNVGVTVTEKEWARMLELLESKTGAKFAGYRSSTLHRRLQHRITVTGRPSMAAYLELLEKESEEAAKLQAAFLIKVSSFFRDPGSWNAVARQIERLAAHTNREIRAWSAGCATGEEAYTFALLLARILGIGAGAQWKVFATDLDEGALKVARAARYTDEQVEGIPKAEMDRHFVREGELWRVNKALRGRVVFGRHDLLHDPLLYEIDLLACRNVLIYFTPAEKKRLVQQLSFSVLPGGILFMGRTETLASVPGFHRLEGTTLFQRNGLPDAMQPGRKTAVPDSAAHLGAEALGGLVAESSAIVAVAINGNGVVVLWNRAAEDFFGKVAEQAVGSPLSKAVGAGVARQLRATIEGQGQRLIRVDDGKGRELHMECLPAIAPATALFIGMARKTPNAKPSRRPAMVTAKLPEEARFLAHQDLTDQLQSRNEELETVNEEMKSLNDELSAMEDEMRNLAGKSQATSDFLRRVIDTAYWPFIACDPDNIVVLWNAAAVRWFGLSTDQAVGKELFTLLPSLDRAPMRAASRKARNVGRGGRAIVSLGGKKYFFDPFPGDAGKRRTYLLRVGVSKDGRK